MVWVPLKYGLIAASFVIILFFTIQIVGKNPLNQLWLFDLFLLPVFILIMLIEFKRGHNYGVLHFWQGMTTGFILYMLVAVVSSVFLFIYVKYLAPELLDNLIVLDLQYLESRNADYQNSPEIYQRIYESIKNNDAIDIMMDNFGKKALAGFFLSSIFSVILRKQPEN